MKYYMSQPKFDTKISCLEQLKDEIEVISEVDTTNYLRFFSFLMFILILINLKIG